MARRAKVAVLSTGVNPGFVMDALPIMLTVACERVESIAVSRVQDARRRRLPFQQKIGAGLSPEQFEREVERGSIRHVGLAESISMIADALGWQLDRITDEVRPKMADATVASEFLAVDAGYVSGIIQDGVGYRHGTPVITMHMEAYLGRARVLRRSARAGDAQPDAQNSGRRPRRHRHRLDCGQFDSRGCCRRGPGCRR